MPALLSVGNEVSQQEKRILFSLLPAELKANRVFLERFISIDNGAFKPCLLLLSNEEERVIPCEWYQEFWNQEMRLPDRAFNNCFLGLINNFGAKTIPWKLLNTTQQEEAVREYFIYPKACDFDVLPHRVLPGSIWYQRFQDFFKTTCYRLSQSHYYDDYYNEEDLGQYLVELSQWPEIYRKGLDCERAVLVKVVSETNFSPRIIKAFEVLTNETLETLGLLEEARRQLNTRYIPYGDVQKTFELTEFIPQQERDYYRKFLDFQIEYGFNKRELPIVWDMWQKKNALKPGSSESNEEIAKKVIRRVYNGGDHEGVAVLKAQENFFIMPHLFLTQLNYSGNI
jgi:hypothetical protein